MARRDWTRAWWDSASERYELVVSVPVIDELEEGSHPNKAAVLDLVADLRIVPVPEEAEEVVRFYIDHQLMPRDVTGDALHLALASLHRCRFLLTWNCRHLANANKFEHIRHVNALLGLHVPILTTPVELLDEGDSDEED